jgi:hypothetical protein
MASNEERIPTFVHIDEQDPSKQNHLILFGFEQELKSITVRNGDSARFEAKIRLISTHSNIHINRSLLHIEWRLNDIRLTDDRNSRYKFDSIPEENLYWMDIRQCEQEDEGVYTISISYDHEKFHDESSAYLFVDSEFILEMNQYTIALGSNIIPNVYPLDRFHRSSLYDRVIDLLIRSFNE